MRRLMGSSGLRTLLDPSRRPVSAFRQPGSALFSENMIAVLLALATFAFPSVASAQLEANLPANPSHYVSDSDHHLTAPQENALSGILIEHDRMTGDQIQIALLNQSQRTPLEDAQELFSQWDCGKRAGGNGALFALFFKEQVVQIELGHGISTRMNDRTIQNVLRHATAPHQTFSAFGQALLITLSSLESPLIANGRALAILQDAGWSPPDEDSLQLRGWAAVGLTLLTAIGFALWGLRRRTLQGIHVSSHGIEPPEFHHAYGIDCERLCQKIKELEVRTRCEIEIQISRSGFRKKKRLSLNANPQVSTLLIRAHLKKKRVEVTLSPTLSKNCGSSWIPDFCAQLESHFELTHPQRVLLQGLTQLESILLRRKA